MHPQKFDRFRKHQKGKGYQSSDGGFSQPAPESNTKLTCYGKYGIKSLVNGRLRSSTIEAVRRVISRRLKRNGQVWVRISADLSISAKPLGARMGKGKGSPAYWGCRVKAGQILYEIDGVTPSVAREVTLLAAAKLPVKVGLIADINAQVYKSNLHNSHLFC